MSNITQFFPGGAGGGGGTTFNRRQIFVGPLSTTWTAAADSVVEVNCWGGGGNGGGGGAPRSGGGGGGGGYVRYIYNLTAGDGLSITVGGSGGTSSVSCPTQSPTSPISATGGSAGASAATPPISPVGNDIPGGAGGVGSGTVPAPRTAYLLTRTGGAGSKGVYADAYPYSYGGGGGSAGSEYGDGIDNTGGPPGKGGVISGGAGIGGKGLTNPPPQTFSEPNPDPTRTPLQWNAAGGPGNWLTNLGAPADLAYTPWFYSYELIGGDGGSGSKRDAPVPSPTSITYYVTIPGGFLAGGSGGSRAASPEFYNTQPNVGGDGGYGGGGGGIGQAGPSYPAPLYNGAGGVGVVIVYFTI
jgi:hypothetical protein